MSDDGSHVFILREHILGQNPNYYWDLRYSISSLNVKTGEENVLFQRDKLLGLNENSVKLNEKSLQ